MHDFCLLSSQRILFTYFNVRNDICNVITERRIIATRLKVRCFTAVTHFSDRSIFALVSTYDRHSRNILSRKTVVVDKTGVAVNFSRFQLRVRPRRVGHVV